MGRIGDARCSRWWLTCLFVGLLATLACRRGEDGTEPSTAAGSGVVSEASDTLRRHFGIDRRELDDETGARLGRWRFVGLSGHE